MLKPLFLLLSFASSVLSEHHHISSEQDALLHPSSNSLSTATSTSTSVSSFSSSFSSFFSSLFTGWYDAQSSSGHGGTDVETYTHTHSFIRRADGCQEKLSKGKLILFSCLIPVLVILSGIFAGLTLGYMSLDETQLNVLSISGTPKQREYANKIKPIRKNGHLLLVTLLLANMITNETLPVISDPVLGGGFQSVVVSTTLIVLFAEIIPQSICTRHGLYIGAKCAGIVRVLIWIFGIVSWPVAKLLEFLLGPHHGIIYRRAELKELIALHGAENPLGGDLQNDTVTIIGATLDLQDKTVRHAMTPINRVFMLHIDAKLDYDTLHRICATGHSRIPVYEEVELTVPAHVAITAAEMGFGDGSQAPAPVKKSIDGESLVKTKVKKIIGVLLVKHCVLLDPEDAVPVRKMRLIKVPFVPQNEPLLGILDRFQEGRSHMAFVSRLSKERAQSVKKEVKKGLTQRLLGALHGDSSASDSSSDSSDDEEENDLSHASTSASDGRELSSRDDNTTAAGKESLKETVRVKFARSSGMHKRSKKRRRKLSTGSGQVEPSDLEKGDPNTEEKREKEKGRKETRKSALEQRMPADAVLSKRNAEEYLASQGIDPAIMPLGIITLEDVLEELIGEEIYDEFDVEGSGAHSHSFVPPGAHPQQQPFSKPGLFRKNSAPELATKDTSHARAGESPPMSPPTSTVQGQGRASLGLAMPKPIALTSLKSLGGLLRSRSAPPTPRDAPKQLPGTNSEGATPPGAATPAAAVNGPKSMDAETVPVGAYPSIVTTPPEEVQQQHGYLPQIMESQSGSEGGSPSSKENRQSGEREHLEGQAQGQNQSSTKAPYLLSNPVVAAVAAGAGAVGASGVPKSRSASPAPSLEAAIFHSKRRRSGAAGAAGGTGSVSGSGSPSPGEVMTGTGYGLSTQSGGGGGGQNASGSGGGSLEQRGRVKGSAFKSSPLGVDASVVVAEEIRKEREREREREKERKERESREARETREDGNGVE